MPDMPMPSMPPWDYDRERLIYPDVVASTIRGDGTYFVTALTNNQDTAVKVHVYWYISPGKEPVLMIEVDDEDILGSEDNMDIRLRVRRNDGLIYEGNRADQENQEETEDG